MVLTQDGIRDIVLPLLDRYDMKSAFLFGSYARGDADEDSDIDALLVGNEGFRPLGILVWPRSSIGSREKRLTYTSSRSFPRVPSEMRYTKSWCCFVLPTPLCS